MGSKLASVYGLVVGPAPSLGTLASSYAVVFHEPAPPDDYTARPDSPLDEPPIWLLDLEVAGHVHRFASEGVTVSDARGASFVYAEGLADPSVALGATTGTGDVSIAVSVVSDDDWAEVVADGHPLDRRPAVLRRWQRGTEIERARVILRGLTSDPEFGAAGEGLSVTIVRSPRSQTADLLDPQAVVSVSTWPDAAAEAVGLPYALVIGAPGGTEDPTPIPVVPVPQVSWSGYDTVSHTYTPSPVTPANYTLPDLPIPQSVKPYVNGVIADHFLVSQYQVTIQVPVVTGGDTVTIDYEEWDTSYVSSWVAWLGGHASVVRLGVETGLDGVWKERDEGTTRTEDALGRPMAAVVQGWPLLVGGMGAAEDMYFVGFRDSAAYGGGLRTRRGDLLRGAGDVIEWVLESYYDGPVDSGRLQAVRGVLNAWKIDTWIDAPVNAMDWLRREILPLVPVELREGEHGLYPAVVRYDLTEADCVRHLVEGADVSRQSLVSFTSDDVRNEITVRFRPGRASTSDWRASRTLTAKRGFRTLLSSSWSTLAGSSGVTETTVSDPSIVPHPLCAASQARYGVRPFVVEAHAVWDATTAVLIADHLAQRFAVPRRKIRYSGDVEELEIGQGVQLTDADLHLDGAVCVVLDLAPGSERGAATVDLLVL